ncbi:conserved Plasmodium protein, unknown function [Plasmodium vivax]|uniref:Uncharacterized protein n=4 Tax=Plasmodium vivax TaxID=5855 RepID=A0A1G4HKY9_PLAVI|nr:hypothetical protein PVIIG_03956 [Plasmodium vivax India VII]KMZ84568.1 hypothetical protein PVBG_00348 [Plasmodium vivax Brazil I]KMZ90347.1 hypothetical protein PVMG_01714 [Plasmodium vivax Mauritania I]CAI7723651.1 conserved Plasmodium protein, unknown function [Plasmodium vivax]SCO70068.1 conserved Plasmodium protein, unknown function [Plasmodium vivax]
MQYYGSSYRKKLIFYNKRKKMLWKQLSKVPNMLLGKRGLRKAVLRFREIKRALKILFKLICRGNIHKLLNKVTTKIIKLWAKCVNNSNAMTKLCNKYYKISGLKIPICDFLFKNKMISTKMEKYSITTPRCYKKNKINRVTNKTSKSTHESMCSSNPNDHYVIDLYDETHIQTPFNGSFLSKNNDSTCESNYNSTQSSDCGRTNENDDLNSNSYLDNDMPSFETLEYDEDEVNESIKNCYLYNGYVNATTYKNSEEYKFLNHHLNEEKNKCADIAIDVSPRSYYDKQLEREKDKREACSQSEQEEDWDQTDAEIKHTQRKKRKRKNKIYEIYNSETTMTQNVYCENYLNENYSSSCDCSSEHSDDDLSANDFTDSDFDDNYFDDVCENDFVCSYSVHSYEAIQSAHDESS